MPKKRSGLFNYSARGMLAVLAVLSMPASASPVTFDYSFSGCVDGGGKFGCTSLPEVVGGGTITFPELFGEFNAAPFSGVELNLTVLNTVFTTDNLTSIFWTISEDASTLLKLGLRLDTDPSWVSPNIGGNDWLEVSFSPYAPATWDYRSDQCFEFGCSLNVTPTDRTVAAQPSVVPLPAAVWLFASALLGLAGVAGRKKV